MDKDMASAFNLKIEGEVKRLTGTGIKLTVTEKDTGEEVNYGVQLNNTTLAIEALPNLKVEVMGYKAIYDALKVTSNLVHNQICYEQGEMRRLLQEAWVQASEALAKADGK